MGHRMTEKLFTPPTTPPPGPVDKPTPFDRIGARS